MKRHGLRVFVVLIGCAALIGLQYARTEGDADSLSTRTSAPSSAAAEIHRPASGIEGGDIARAADDNQSGPSIAESASKSHPAASAGVEPSQRARVQAHLHALMACQPGAVTKASEREQLWRMTLPPEAIEGAPAQYETAESWARQTCAKSSMQLGAAPVESGDIMALWSELSPDGPLRRLSEASVETEVDVLDPSTLQARREQTEALIPMMRPLLEQALAEALREPSVLEFQAIAEAAGRFHRRRGRLGPFAGSGSALWRLAACDLGADCGPESPAAHLICYHEQLCGYGSLEEALIDAYWPQMQIDQLQAARQQLVERLRAGGHGVFEPDPPGGG